MVRLGAVIGRLRLLLSTWAYRFDIFLSFFRVAAAACRCPMNFAILCLQFLLVPSVRLAVVTSRSTIFGGQFGNFFANLFFATVPRWQGDSRFFGHFQHFQLLISFVPSAQLADVTWPLLFSLPTWVIFIFQLFFSFCRLAAAARRRLFFFANLVCFNVHIFCHLSDSRWLLVYHHSACQFDSPPFSGFSLLSYISLLNSSRAAQLSARETLFSVFKTSDKCASVCCNTLQHTATHCNTLQHCNTLRAYKSVPLYLRRLTNVCFMYILKMCHMYTSRTMCVYSPLAGNFLHCGLCLLWHPILFLNRNESLNIEVVL